MFDHIWLWSALCTQWNIRYGKFCAHFVPVTHNIYVCIWDKMRSPWNSTRNYRWNIEIMIYIYLCRSRHIDNATNSIQFICCVFLSHRSIEFVQLNCVGTLMLNTCFFDVDFYHRIKMVTTKKHTQFFRRTKDISIENHSRFWMILCCFDFRRSRGTCMGIWIQKYKTENKSNNSLHWELYHEHFLWLIKTNCVSPLRFNHYMPIGWYVRRMFGYMPLYMVSHVWWRILWMEVLAQRNNFERNTLYYVTHTHAARRHTQNTKHKRTNKHDILINSQCF